MITPWPHQDKLVSRLADAFRASKRVLGVSPCGSGKTPMTALMAARAVARGRRPVVSVPRRELLWQTVRTFEELGVPAGIVSGGYNDTSKPVIIGTMQTLVERDYLGDFLINDEAHYGLSDAWNAHLQGYGWVLGLTASPIPGMDKTYEVMIEGPTVAELIDGGFLSKYRAFAPSTPDLSKIPVSHGEYSEKPLAEFMAKPSVTGSAVDAWLRFAKGLRTVGYAVSRVHSREIVSAFLAAGIPAEHIDGDHTHEERRAIIARFADGQTRFLSSVDLITLGFDMSSQIGRNCPIEALSDQRPTKSFPMQTQKWGRALRKKDQPAIILDHANNFVTHGLPDDPVEWSIAGRITRAKGVLPVSICSGCLAAFRTAPACPYCGTERQLTPREVERREGELREIEAKREAKAKRIEVGRADGLDGVAKIAAERKYKVGWVVRRMALKGKTVSYDEAMRAMKNALDGTG